MRRILLLFCFVFVLSLCFGQRSNAVSNFKGGFRAGLTTSQISGDNLGGFHQIGACAGVFANIPLNDMLDWKLQLEMDFVMKGSHSFVERNQVYNPTQKYVLNLGYLEIPVLMKWNFGKRITINGKPVVNGFELEFGPVLGVKAYQLEKDWTGVIPATVDNGRMFRRFELSAMAGLGYLFKEHHGISLRYSNSLIPVRIPNWAYDRLTQKQFNSVIMASYYYQF